MKHDAHDTMICFFCREIYVRATWAMGSGLWAYDGFMRLFFIV